MGAAEAEYCQLTLAPKLASKAAVELYAQLKEHRGSMVALNASGVEQLGILCMQIIVSAAKTWNDEGVSFEVVEPSAAFVESAELVGLDVALMGVQSEWSETNDA
ncbi:MAG: STAS domain-containing protein [Pseudomonadota bacterium]